MKRTKKSVQKNCWILEWAIMNGLLVYNEPDNKDKAYKEAVRIFNQYFL